MLLEVGKTYQVNNLTYAHYGAVIVNTSNVQVKDVFFIQMNNTKPITNITRLYFHYITEEDKNVVDLYNEELFVARINLETRIQNTNFIVFTVVNIDSPVELENSVTHVITELNNRFFDGSPNNTHIKGESVSYKSYPVFSDEIIEWEANENYSLYRLIYNFRGYISSIGLTGWNEEITIDFDDYKIDNKSVRLPCGISCDFSCTGTGAILITEKHVYYDDGSEADVIPVDSVLGGVTYDVNYGDDLTVIFKCVRDATNYRFTEQSVQAYIDALKEELTDLEAETPYKWEDYFESVDGEVNDTFDRMTITIHKVAKDFDLYDDAYLGFFPLVEKPTITYNLTHCSIEDAPTHATYNDELDLIVDVDEYFIIEDDDITILMGSEDITESAWDKEQHVIHIDAVTDDLIITINASQEYALVVHKSSTSADKLDYTGSKVIESLSMTVNNDVIGVTVNGTSFGTLNIPLGENDVIIGLGINESQEVFVPVGVIINNIDLSQYGEDGVLNLYPIIVNTAEPTTFEINLYNMNCDKNTVDKTDGIVAISTLSGTLRESSDLMNPVIKFETTRLPRFNYVYIPAFRRYYFLQEITVITDKLYSMSLHVDVLMTYKNEIRSQECMVARNEFDFNAKIEDVMRKKYAGNGINFIDIHKSNDLLDDGVLDNSRSLSSTSPIILEVMGDN